jgi:hypothetical protein
MPLDLSPDSPENPDRSTELVAGSTPTSLVASRRTMLKSAALAGVGVATAGVVADILFAGPAAAATSAHGSSEGDLVAHVRDARSGHIDLYVGTRAVSVRDRALASRLANAAK